MSDPFDPDAWPRSSGSGGSSPRKDEQQPEDDFNPFASSQTQNDEDDDYDNAVFGGSKNAYDSSYGDVQDDDEDYSTTGGVAAGTQDADYGTGSGRDRNLGNEYRDDFDDDEYGNYNNFDDDNGYDDFDGDFDREPQDGGGNNLKKILAIVGAVVLAGIIGGGLLQVISGGNGDDVATDTTTTAIPQTTSAPATTTPPVTETPPATNAPPAVNTPEPTSPGAGTAGQAPKDLTDTLNAGLTAWGKFAVDGNIAGVTQYFAPNTKQFNRFQLDAEAISASPPGGEAIKVAMENPTTLKTDDNNWTVRGPVTWSRPGELTQNFNWELRMTRTSDRQPWQIISVRQF